MHVLDVATRKPLSDRVEWMKVSASPGVVMKGSSIAAIRLLRRARRLPPRTNTTASTITRSARRSLQDELVFEDKDKKNSERFHTAGVTEDERYLLLYVSDRSKGLDGNALYFRDLTKNDKTFTPIVR